MSKKRRALWAWLTAFAMVISVLSGHAGPYRAYAAEGEPGSGGTVKTLTGSAIESNLILGKTYSGTAEFTANEYNYAAGFYVSDAELKSGDMYDITLTLGSGAEAYDQVAIASSCNGWAWDNAFAIWPDSVVAGTRMYVTHEVKTDLSGGFSFQIQMVKRGTDIKSGESFIAEIESLKVTKRKAAEAISSNLSLETQYAGEVALEKDPYGENYAAYFNIADADIQVGDKYDII
ncbi:MAG: hypothetical protein K2N94_05245, partial [Lachnospiraceae bacterium]|nr:hypothetical protein [Lachnospiraceae bacterium]